MAFPLNDQVYTKSFTPREYQVKERPINSIKKLLICVHLMITKESRKKSAIIMSICVMNHYIILDYRKLICAQLFVGRASLCSKGEKHNRMFREKLRANFPCYKTNSRVCYQQQKVIINITYEIAIEVLRNITG